MANVLHTSAPKVFTFTEPLELQVVDGDTDVQAGGTVDISGSGFAPGTDVDILMFSSPRRLTTVASDGAGRFTATVTIPADSDAGAHLLVASGLDALGEVQSVSLDIDVLAATRAPTPNVPVASPASPSASSSAEPSPASLAATGRAFGFTLGAGLIMFMAGALMVLAERRRARS